MSFTVLLIDDAVADIEELINFISEHDSTQNADYVLSGIEECLTSLASLPDRGTFPKELSVLGIREYREIFFKPYRIIYRVLGNTVYVYLIVDGRRDMQTLLQRRLLSTQ